LCIEITALLGFHLITFKTKNHENSTSVSKPDHENLYSLIKKKEIELRRKKRGTLHPVKPNRWKHVSYKGFIDFYKANKDISIFELKQKSTESNDWQLLHSFLGFLDRHFHEEIESITILYRD
jgi:hypothetical protein